MVSRWTALAFIFVSFLQFTLNWFAIVPAFGPLAGAMHIGLPQMGIIVGVFVGGYGITHIPAGLIAEAWGMKNAMLLGVALEAAGAALSAAAPDFMWLLAARFICGVGGSIYFGSVVGLTAGWFRDHELVTANGLVTGVAFIVGAAIGLFVWGPLIAAFGWRAALFWGAAVSVVTFLAVLIYFPVPPGAAAEQIRGAHLDRSVLRRVFGDRDLWLLGLAFFGGYGGYFTATQLLPEYARHALGLSPSGAQLLGVVVLIAGIPGSFLGGWLVDRMFGAIPIFLGACLAEGIAMWCIPMLGIGGVEIAATAIGAILPMAFVTWISMPGLYRERLSIADIPTAAGLLLTIAAVGGVAVPALYSHIAAALGYSQGWHVAGLLCIGSSFFCLAARRPARSRGEAADVLVSFEPRQPVP